MSISTKYQINQNFIPNLPQEPYRKGIGQYEGVCMHATASFNDSSSGERNYETNHAADAFVHTFTDDTQILQVADLNYLSYGCCHTGNQFLTNNELCQSHDHNLFLLAYDRWVWLGAYQLFQRKLGVIDKVTLFSHKEVTDIYKESDHQDPISYLAEHGMTWQNVVQDVTNYYSQFEEEEKLMNELLTQLQVEVQALKEYNSMAVIPSWSQEAINYFVQQGWMVDPNGRSYDTYATVTMMYRVFKAKQMI